MIEYIGRDGEPEASLCPAFICDACRQQITQGLVLHGATYENGHRYATPLHVACRGRCYQQVAAHFHNAYPGMYGDLTEDIHTFVKHLTHNSTNAFTDDPEGTYHQHTIVMPGTDVFRTRAPRLMDERKQ